MALFDKSTPNGYTLSNRSPTSNMSEYKRKGDEWPSWIPILFRPPDYMNLDDVDFAVVAYVFAPNKSRDELLVRTNKFLGTRCNLKSLIPKEWVHGEVLDLVATMLTIEEKDIGCQTHWYLPATFSQFILDSSATVETLQRYYKNEYMGKVDEGLQKVFIPVNESNLHWYLVVFDLYERQIIMLDSLPILALQEGRRSTIEKIGTLPIIHGKFLQKMLEDDSFYKYNTPFRPQLSDYAFVDTLDTGEQTSGSLRMVQG